MPENRERNFHNPAEYLEPGNWDERKQRLEKTPTGLYDVIGLFGSTHNQATWRKDEGFQAGLNGAEAFNPQVADWDPSYAAREAEVLATAAVIVFRIENKEVRNGSLGSIAEIGLAVASALLRGQRVVVSFEEGFEQSLAESPSAHMQLEALMVIMEAFVKKNPGYVTLHNGNELQKLAEISQQLKEQQKASPQELLDKTAVLERQKQNLAQPNQFTAVTGSSSAYSPILKERYQQERGRIMDALHSYPGMVKDLTTGSLGAAWNRVYQLPSTEARSALLGAELDLKLESHRLIVPVHDEALTKAGSTEIGWFLVNALLTGQRVAILMEPFSADAFLTAHKMEKEIYTRDPELFKKTLVSSEIFSQEALDSMSDDEVEAMRAELGQQVVSFSKLKKTRFRESALWQEADNTQRVRSLVEAHIAKLHEEFPELFVYATNMNDFSAALREDAKLQLLQEDLSPKQMEEIQSFVASQLEDPTEGVVFAAEFDSRKRKPKAEANSTDPMTAEMARKLLEKQLDSGIVIGGSEVMRETLVDLLQCSEEQLVLSESIESYGPNMMPDDRKAITVSLRANQTSPQVFLIKLISQEQYSGSNGDWYDQQSYTYKLDKNEVTRALDKVLNGPKLPKYTQSRQSESSTDSLWWKD